MQHQEHAVTWGPGDLSRPQDSIRPTRTLHGDEARCVKMSEAFHPLWKQGEGATEDGLQGLGDFDERSLSGDQF